MIASDWDRPVEIRLPERPKPIDFSFDRAVDSFELSMVRKMEGQDGVDRLFERLKHQAARELAAHIAKNCKWFEEPDFLSPELRLRMHLTIEDRGAYQNWIPVAEQQGRSEGWKQAMRAAAESLPYGLTDAAQEFYE